MRILTFFCILALTISLGYASSKSKIKDQIPQFDKPGALDFLTHIPDTMVDTWNLSFNTKKSTLTVWSGIFVSTYLLYLYDEEILAEFQRWGRKLGLGNDDKTKTLLRWGRLNLFRGPTDVGSSMYYIGDGWTHFAVAGGFAMTGWLGKSNRALQTGSQIFHGMMASTIANQIGKRSFGRESPYRKTTDRGAWRPFPSPSTYNNNISKYDAMPSGHIMTATLTYTIIDNNYPEHRYWFRPLGITLITLLGYQMVNNSVHWISDYPLGIAMGYVFGKVVTKYGRKKVKTGSQGTPVNSSIAEKINWFPIAFHYPNERRYGFMATLDF